MLLHAVQYSITAGVERIVAVYLPTQKNKPCFDFWKNKSGFTFLDEQNSFIWDFSKPFPEISHIEILCSP